MTAIAVLSFIAAGLYSTRRTVWGILETNRRVQADIAFMQAMPSRMDEKGTAP